MRTSIGNSEKNKMWTKKILPLQKTVCKNTKATRIKQYLDVSSPMLLMLSNKEVWPVVARCLPYRLGWAHLEKVA